MGGPEPIVWLDGASADDGRTLFPDRAVALVPKRVTGVEWALSAGVLFGPTRAGAAEEHVAALLAAGVEVVVQRETRPPGPWPWEVGPIGWRARVALVGPRARVDGRVYDAVDLRLIGRSPKQRRHAVLLVGLFAVAAVGASLVRRRAALAVAGVTVFATGGLVAWGGANPTLVQERVTVVVVSEHIVQVDDWTFQRSPDRMQLRIRPAEVGWPVLRSGRHEAQANLMAREGDVSYDVTPALPMALLRRELQAVVPVPPNLVPVDLRTRRLVGLYASPAVRLLGVQQGGDAGVPIIWFKRDSQEASDAR